MVRKQTPNARTFDNHWGLGPVELRLLEPPPEHLHGATGCVLNNGIFDAALGPEVYLVILEAGEKNATEVGAAHPFHLFCKTGVAQTDHGLVAFLLWTVSDSSRRVAWYEHFLNPHNEEALLLLEIAGRQTHFKVLVYDSLSGRVVNWFEFDSKFGLGEFAAWLREFRGDRAPGDFVAAQADFIKDHNIEELLEWPPELLRPILPFRRPTQR